MKWCKECVDTGGQAKGEGVDGLCWLGRHFVHQRV